jgi:sulfonate transport system substrate-binding protein
VEFQAGPPLLEAMRGGAVDIGYVGETPPVFAQAGGVPFVYVAADARGPASEAILVRKDSNITKLAELEGKRIAVNRGSNVHYPLVRALTEAKLTIKEVRVLYLAPPDARTAFASGQVDAWVIWDPFQAAAELDGARTLRDGKDLVDNRLFYVARREFAQEHAALLNLGCWLLVQPDNSRHNLESYRSANHVAPRDQSSRRGTGDDLARVRIEWESRAQRSVRLYVHSDRVRRR